MRRLILAALIACALPGLALAQQPPQPSADDMRAALDAAMSQRDRALGDQLEAAVMMRRLVAAAEAQKATLIEWLKDAQAKAASAQ